MYDEIRHSKKVTFGNVIFKLFKFYKAKIF